MYTSITIYGGTYCPHCFKLKAKLDALDIKYEYKNIDENDEWKDEIVSRGFQSIPVLQIGDLYLNPAKDDYMQYLRSE